MITVSIVVYKTDPAELRALLDCVQAEGHVERAYVVDNSPNDELRALSTAYPLVAYIWGQGNVGYGAGHNIAFAKSIQAGAKYHVVLNPDISFDRGSIGQLEDFMQNHPDVGQAMPKVIYPNGDIQYLCKLLPTPINLFGRRFLPFAPNNDRFEMRRSGYNRLLDVPFLSGCFIFLRMDAVEQVGGFDDRFFMYCEDIDLCRRIGMAGYRTVYVPMVAVVHAHKKESFKSRLMLKAHIRSAIRYFNKWGWVFDTYRSKTNKKAEKQYE